jgi:hypothetical protein
MNPNNYRQARVEIRSWGIYTMNQEPSTSGYVQYPERTCLRNRQSSELVGEASRLTELESVPVYGFTEFWPLGA